MSMNLDPKNWEDMASLKTIIKHDIENHGEVIRTFDVRKTALKCVRCGSLASLGPCENCDSKTYEPGVSTSKQVGLFCTQCEQGFLSWTCQKCGTENTVNKSLVGLKGRCFIATAAFDHPDAPEVLILQEFRDQVLLNSYIGRFCVFVYYTISPSLAKILSRSERLKCLTRKIIRHVIRKFII
jgi:hypothetical protein